MVCVRDFPHGEVSVKVAVMEFGPKAAQDLKNTVVYISTTKIIQTELNTNDKLLRYNIGFQ